MLSSKPTKEVNPYNSCVRTAQQVFPEIPLIDAIEYKPNGTMENSEIVLLQYKSKKSDGYVYHIAPYKMGTSTLHIYHEGNFEEGKMTERDIEKDDPHILGFWDYDLYLKIKELPQSAQDTLKCESHLQHYKADGSVMIGPTHDFGIAQFTRQTWNYFNDLRAGQKLPRLYEMLDPFQQIEMVDFAWKNNLEKNWYCYQGLEPSTSDPVSQD